MAASVMAAKCWNLTDRHGTIDSVTLEVAVPITVHIPAALEGRTGSRRVLAGGATIREVILSLEETYPGMGFHLLHETGELRPFVNVFLDTENVRFLQGLDTPVPAQATVHIIHSVAGG